MNTDSTHPGTSTRPDGPYRTRVTGRAARLLPLALVAVGLVLLLTDTGGAVAAIVAVLLSLLVWGLLDVRITAGADGLVLAFGPWRRPRVRVPSTEIEHVEVQHANPFTYGGWGYRIRPGTRAFLLRRGPAVRVVRRDRPDLLVTTSDAQRVADALTREPSR